MPATCGFPELADHVPTSDAEPVALLREAGAIPFGKTNVPFAAADHQELQPGVRDDEQPMGRLGSRASRRAGRPPRSPPGSLRWSSAATSRSSIRIPSHFCDISGHKPSSGSCHVVDTSLRPEPPDQGPCPRAGRWPAARPTSNWRWTCCTGAVERDRQPGRCGSREPARAVARLPGRAVGGRRGLQPGLAVQGRDHEPTPRICEGSVCRLGRDRPTGQDRRRGERRPLRRDVFSVQTRSCRRTCWRTSSRSGRRTTILGLPRPRRQGRALSAHGHGSCWSSSCSCRRHGRASSRASTSSCVPSSRRRIRPRPLR